MPNGIQSYGDYNQSTSGYRVLQPRPLDVYLGPWESIGTGNTAGTTSGGVSLANSIIGGGVRYQGLQVIIIANSNPGQAGGQTLAYKYWYCGGTADSNLVEFSSGSVGEAFSSSTSYNWTAPQYFSQGFSAAGGVTFTSLTHFTAGLSAAGATIGTLVVNNGISANGGATFANNVHVGGTLSVTGNFYVAGTLTTVNESQLLIQDKYLVLGSEYTIADPSAGASGGLYLGNTGSPTASLVYNNTLKSWDSNLSVNVAGGATGYYINGNFIASGSTIGNSNTEWNGKVISTAKGGFGNPLANFSAGFVYLSGGSPQTVSGSLIPNTPGTFDVVPVLYKSSQGGTAAVTPIIGNSYTKTVEKQSITQYINFDYSTASGGLVVWDENTAGPNTFNPDGFQGATLSIPLISKKTGNLQYNYLFYDDREAFNVGYNVNTGTLYFKQVEAIVDGGIF